MTITLAWGNSKSDIRSNEKDICYNREKIERIYKQLDRIEKCIDDSYGSNDEDIEDLGDLINLINMTLEKMIKNPQFTEEMLQEIFRIQTR